MSIKRLHEGFGVGEDSCISGIHPMREGDPPGVYLGRNPEAQGQGLYVTYWEADEIAQKIGFPHIAVYEEQVRLIDEQAQQIADLEHALNNEIHNEQMKAVLKAVTNVKKEVLDEVSGLTAAIRTRLGNSGSDSKSAPRTAVRSQAASGRPDTL